MELSEDGCSVPGWWPDAMEQGLASMHVDDARVVVTVNFVETVAQVIGNPAYTAERGGGTVAARTVAVPEGSVVVLNYNELSAHSPASIQRLLAHEAGHILLNARGNEETSGHRDSDEADWQWWLKCMGALAIVELRIERTLIELGYPPAEWIETTLLDHRLMIVNAEIVGAVIDPASEDPAYFQDRVLATMDHATKLLAYIAAPIIAGKSNFSPSQLSADGQLNWADYIAPTWQQRIAFWTQIPPVHELIPTETWRTILRKAARIEQALMLDFGFEFASAPNGQHGFYRRASDAVITRRIERTVAQIQAQ